MFSFQRPGYLVQHRAGARRWSQKGPGKILLEPAEPWPLPLVAATLRRQKPRPARKLWEPAKQRMWENGSWEPTPPPCPFSPQPPWGLLLFSFTKLGPCQGSGPHNFPRIRGCSRRGLRVAQGWRIRVEHLGTRKGEARGFIPLVGTYYQ